MFQFVFDDMLFWTAVLVRVQRRQDPFVITIVVIQHKMMQIGRPVRQKGRRLGRHRKVGPVGIGVGNAPRKGSEWIEVAGQSGHVVQKGRTAKEVLAGGAVEEGEANLGGPGEGDEGEAGEAEVGGGGGAKDIPFQAVEAIE